MPDYLLQQTVEDLHFENVQWLSKIDFWETELNFFYKILIKSAKVDSNDSDDHIIEGLIKKYSHFQKASIRKLKEDVLEHERYLSKIDEKKTDLGYNGYKEKHALLEELVNDSGKKIKSLKKELLSLVEELL